MKISLIKGYPQTRLLFVTWAVLSASFLGCGGREKQKSEAVVINLVEARNLGLAYLEENRLDEAEVQFRKVTQHAPDDPMGYANLGLVYLRRGEFSKAESELHRALKLTPDDPNAGLILADVYDASGENEKAIEALRTLLAHSPGHLRSLYKIVEITAKMAYSHPDDRTITTERQNFLAELVNLSAANIPVRLQLIESLLSHGETDSALAHMEALNQQIPEPPKEAVSAVRESLKQMQLGNNGEASRAFRIVHNVLKVTPRYQADLWELRGSGGALSGFPLLDFSESLSQRVEDESTVLKTLRFTDATSLSGLDVVNEVAGKLSTPVLAVGDVDGDKAQDVYCSVWDGARNHIFLLKQEFGEFTNIASETGVGHGGIDLDARFADIDNNGHLDLLVTNTAGARYYKNGGEGTFDDVSSLSGLGSETEARYILPADFDHDGDLDVYMLKDGRNLLWRNNLDGTFREMAEKMKIDGGEADSRGAAFGDFDDDGDLDIFVVNRDVSHKLLSNLRQGQFEDVTGAADIGGDGENSAVTAGDYNNDGLLDLFIAGDGLFRNSGEGTFETVEIIAAELKAVNTSDAKFFDFDNDGYLDILVAGESGVTLLHNEQGERFADMSHLLPESAASAQRLAVIDYNVDGDLDILLAASDGKLRLLRNDGGSVNKYLKVRLVGLRVGSGKNNHFGIGAKVEIRAGDLYQSRVVTDEVTHFGLGQRLKADVMRIIWTNGVPQNLFFPGSDQDIVEEQILKGSCPFLYAWNGERFEFVKDILWRSALGMPLGIMAGEMAYGFASSTEEYVKIPGDALAVRDGEYALQLTMELWETNYYDEVKLHVVDHPVGTEVYIDEKFAIPPYPPHKIQTVSEKRLPASATDGDGNNVLPLLEAWDYRYVSNLMPTQFQGIVEPHDLILDLGDVSRAEEVILYLHGWIFPSDASINVNRRQSQGATAFPPRVQVTDENGEWKTVIGSINFPNGKDKTCIVDLSGKFLTDDTRVRLQTSMQIYWDHIFFTVDEPEVNVVETVLSATSADLHYRGFSATYRKGGRYGPHWFDYSTVTSGSKWRDLTGNYTRYGDVRALLESPDDMTVIMNSGDELTVKFAESDAPPLKEGWTRDYLLYSDGWLKDGDLNTATGNRVGPLPFQALDAYPYGAGQVVPDDERYRDYLKMYNTRVVTTDEFRKKLVPPSSRY